MNAAGGFLSSQFLHEVTFLPGEREEPDDALYACARKRKECKGRPMNYTRVFLAALGGFVVYFVMGGLLFAVLPWLRTEFQKYPAVYRSHEGIKRTMPFGMAAMFVAILALAMIYAMFSQTGSANLLRGAQFGGLVGVFAIGSFVVHNYVNLNIGWKLTGEQAVAYFFEWLAVGIAFGIIYRPAR